MSEDSALALRSRLEAFERSTGGPLKGEDSATLVCRVDEYRPFEHEPLPSRDMDPAFVALHKRVTQRNAQILYKGTRVNSYSDAAALPECEK